MRLNSDIQWDFFLQRAIDIKFVNEFASWRKCDAVDIPLYITLITTSYVTLSHDAHAS